jgi:hypothetical protein
MKISIIISTIFIAAFLFIFLKSPEVPIQYENEFAKSLENIVCGSTVRFLTHIKNKGEFIVGLGYEVRSLKYKNDKIQMTKNIFRFDKSYGEYIARKLPDDSFYVTHKDKGYLLNPDLEVIREDNLTDMQTETDFEFDIGSSWISPEGKTLAFSRAYSIEMGGFWVADLSNKQLQFHEDDLCIGFTKVNDNVYFLSSRSVNDTGRCRIVIRDSVDWKTINEIPIKKTEGHSNFIFPNCYATCKALNNNKGGVVIGTTDGRLIILSFPSFGVHSEIKLSSNRIKAMCTVDDKTIAVGDRKGQIYLVNIISGKINKLPTVECDRAMTAMSYQPSSGILAVGFFLSHVRMWKLKKR